ncbi:MAG: hypothetical protein QME81_16285 [bacterium]|nr:hypothetical protein [bacterium]
MAYPQEIIRRYEGQIDQTQCYYLTSFDTRFVKIRDFVKQIVTEQGLTPKDANTQKPGQIDTQILEDLAKAGVVIVDITGVPPNVMIEVGICFATKPEGTVILITQDPLEKLPFYLKMYRTFQYKPEWGEEGKFREDLTKFLQEAVKVAQQVVSVKSPKTVSVETSSTESTKLFDNIHTGKNGWRTYLEQYLNDSEVCQSLLDYVLGTMRRPRLRAAWSLQFFPVELFDKAVKTVSSNILAEDDKRLLSSIRDRSVWDFLNTLSKGDDPEMSRIANQIKSEIQSQWAKSEFPMKSESIEDRPLA